MATSPVSSTSTTAPAAPSGPSANDLYAATSIPGETTAVEASANTDEADKAPATAAETASAPAAESRSSDPLLLLLLPPRPLPFLRVLVMALLLPVQTTAVSAIHCGLSVARPTSSKKKSAPCASS